MFLVVSSLCCALKHIWLNPAVQLAEVLDQQLREKRASLRDKPGEVERFEQALRCDGEVVCIAGAYVSTK